MKGGNTIILRKGNVQMIDIATAIEWRGKHPDHEGGPFPASNTQDDEGKVDPARRNSSCLPCLVKGYIWGHPREMETMAHDRFFCVLEA